MVNLVLVSHSHLVAEGTRQIALQMAGDTVQVVAAGGVQDAAGAWSLGTDPVRIAQAIREVASESGVLLLVDMGSAVMSAEQALELLTDDVRELCMISSAPLVEGAIVAALEAGMGRDLLHVDAAARMACQTPKR
jgi:dihydroxyacetone kinase phosphotransfer subunit